MRIEIGELALLTLILKVWLLGSSSSPGFTIWDKQAGLFQERDLVGFGAGVRIITLVPCIFKNLVDNDHSHVFIVTGSF